MSQDIDAALKGWDFKSGVVQARLVQAGEGRQVIQMRVDLGILQMETAGRPDGTRPHGSATYFEYLRQQARDPVPGAEERAARARQDPERLCLAEPRLDPCAFAHAAFPWQIERSRIFEHQALVAAKRGQGAAPAELKR